MEEKRKNPEEHSKNHQQQHIFSWERGIRALSLPSG